MIDLQRVFALFTFITVVGATGCGTSNDQAADSGGGSGEEANETTTKRKPPPQPTPQRPDRAYRIGYEATDGSTAEGTIKIGQLESLDDAIRNGYQAACFDGEVGRAAVMPGEAAITNTTPKFSTDLTMTLEIDEAGYASNDPIVDSDAGDCRQGISFLERKETPPGESLGPIPFGIVFPSYYSPRFPNGDISAAEGWQLSIGSTFMNFDTTCVSGPGVGQGADIPIGEKENLSSDNAEEDTLPRC